MAERHWAFQGQCTEVVEFEPKYFGELDAWFATFGENLGKWSSPTPIHCPFRNCFRIPGCNCESQWHTKTQARETYSNFGVVEQFRFPRFNEVAEAVKAFEGRRSALEMLDAFRYPKIKLC